MGLDLAYRCGGRECSVRFSMADWETIDRLRSHLPDDVATMADVADFGAEVLVPLDALRVAIGRVDGLLRDRPGLLPRTYEFKCEYVAVGDARIEGFDFSTGGHCGFRLPGDDEHCYAIRAGVDECRLEQMAVQPDGTGKVVARPAGRERAADGELRAGADPRASDAAGPPRGACEDRHVPPLAAGGSGGHQGRVLRGSSIGGSNCRSAPPGGG